MPRQINCVVDYKFSRAEPSDAIVASGSQTINIFSKDFNNLETLKKFSRALKDSCSGADGEEHQIALNSSGSFNPVLYLGIDKEIELLLPEKTSAKGTTWNKGLVLVFNPCQKYWQLNQNISDEAPEFKVLRQHLSPQNTTAFDADKFGLSLFIISRRVLPSYLSLPLVSFYISIIYVISQLFRRIFVPRVSEYFIEDAPNPDDILMLCETINLYRLKGRHKEEEELYFLLIDIMRNPQVFKVISGESKKSDPLAINQETNIKNPR